MQDVHRTRDVARKGTNQMHGRESESGGESEGQPKSSPRPSLQDAENNKVRLRLRLRLRLRAKVGIETEVTNGPFRVSGSGFRVQEHWY